jgi:hypothetical protein
MFWTTLRYLAALIGILAYYVAFFMYEDQEGELQNRIEKLWMAVYDKAKLTGSRTIGLFNAVAEVVTRGFDRVFGRKLFSFQSVGVSTSYSFAGLFLFFSFVLINLIPGSSRAASVPAATLKELTRIGWLSLVAGIICFLVAILPSFWPSRWFVGMSLIPYFFLYAQIAHLTPVRLTTRGEFAMLVALHASFLSDVLLIVVVRFSVRVLSTKASLSNMVLAALAQVSLPLLLVGLPGLTGVYLRTEFGRARFEDIPLFIGSFNLFTGLASSIFALVLLFVLLHRAMWPVLSKVFYPLARYELVRNHKIMAGIGTGCFVFAFPAMSGATRGVLAWLAK